MATATVTKAKVFENSSAVLLARVVGQDGNPIVTADVDAMTLYIFDGETPINGTGGVELDVDATDSIISDSLVTDDPRWDVDEDGFNVEIPIDGENFPDGNKTYRVEVKVEPVDGGAFYLVWDVTTIEIQAE
jgi:hypothetical protein